jgi:hypothetical protein
MSKFSKKNRPKPKDKMVGVMFDSDEMARLEAVAFNKSGWCRDAILAALNKHDYELEQG